MSHSKYLIFNFYYNLIIIIINNCDCFTIYNFEISGEPYISGNHWRDYNYGHNEFRHREVPIYRVGPFISQEGISYCIIGQNLKKSKFNETKIGKSLSNLLGYFDQLNIGSFTHPDDYSNFKYVESDDPFLKPSPHYEKRISGEPPKFSPDDQRLILTPLIDHQPDPDCINPYFIEVNEIITKHLESGFSERLKNWLHITVYSKIEMKDVKKKNCPKGKIKYLLLEVRDQKGNAVGEFTEQLPCGDSCHCKTKECKLFQGNSTNAHPCMYINHRAVTHPGLFFVGPDDSEGGEGFDEVHATWRFSQHTSYFISELHFAALIIEDDKKIPYWTSGFTQWQHWKARRYSSLCNDNYGSCYEIYRERQFDSSNIFLRHGDFKTWLTFYQSNDEIKKPFGFTARYHILEPKLKTLGAFDYFRKSYYTDKEIDCHGGISDDHYNYVYNEGLLPYTNALYDWPAYEFRRNTKDRYGQGIHLRGSNPTNLGGVTAIKTNMAIFMTHFDWENPTREYQGTLYSKAMQNEIDFGHDERDRHSGRWAKPLPAFINDYITKNLSTMAQIADSERCACPLIHSTPLPEFQTKSPNELQGRQLHTIQMAIAWMVLFPLAIFVARYYKETYARTYFLQEFWWFTVHLFCLITAFIFMLGGIYVIEIKKEPAHEWTEETWVHIIFGVIAIILVFLMLVFGVWRPKNVETRIYIIMAHFIVGITALLLAIAAILVAAAMPYSFMNCSAFAVFIIFLILLIVIIIFMEIHMRKVDRTLKLNPPRSYLPPPVVRLFHRNAPLSKFRIYFLVFFVCFLCILTIIMLYFTTKFRQEGSMSCYQKKPPEPEPDAEEPLFPEYYDTNFV